MTIFPDQKIDTLVEKKEGITKIKKKLFGVLQRGILAKGTSGDPEMTKPFAN